MSLMKVYLKLLLFMVYVIDEGLTKILLFVVYVTDEGLTNSITVRVV